MINWLALPRYNFIEASFNAAVVAMIWSGRPIAAIIYFGVGVILSIYLGRKARK